MRWLFSLIVIYVLCKSVFRTQFRQIRRTHMLCVLCESLDEFTLTEERQGISSSDKCGVDCLSQSFHLTWLNYYLGNSVTFGCACAISGRQYNNNNQNGLPFQWSNDLSIPFSQSKIYQLIVPPTIIVLRTISVSITYVVVTQTFHIRLRISTGNRSQRQTQ